MAVVISLGFFLLACMAVQAEDDWKYRIMKIKDNKTYTNYHFFVNSQERTCSALDIHNRLVAFSNGQSGALFIFNYETFIAIYFSNGIRYENSKDFDDYIKKNTLKELFYKHRPKGYLCQPDTTPPGFSKSLTEIFKHLIDGFSSECQAFSTGISMAKITSDRLLSSLSGIDNLIGNTSVESPIDIECLVNLYQGLGDFFKNFHAGIKSLIKKQTKFDFSKILQSASKSGFHVIVNLIEWVSSQLENVDSLFDCLNDQYRFFVLVRRLGGDKNSGNDKHPLNNFIYAIVDVMSVITKELSLNNLKTTLKIYHESGSSGKDIEKRWQEAVKLLQDSIKKYKLERKLKDLVKILQDIRDERWKFKGVDMSKICKFLFSLKKEDKGSLDVVKKFEDFFKKNWQDFWGSFL